MKSPGVRAAPLPPEQRRAGIVAAALPLIRKHGADVTTKQIADAAGIAEGTIFRVFNDKESLIDAVVRQAFDPAATVVALLAVDLTLPLSERLRAAVEIIAGQLDAVWELMSALRMMGPPEHNARLRAALPHQHDDRTPLALIALIEPDRDQLRLDAAQVARILRLMTFAGTHPRISDNNPLTSDEIVDLLMNGVRANCAAGAPARAGGAAD